MEDNYDSDVSSNDEFEVVCDDPSPGQQVQASTSSDHRCCENFKINAFVTHKILEFIFFKTDFFVL